MSSYSFDNAWIEARRRLQLLEVALDPGTVRRLVRLGVRDGWQCLEVGAGGGSIATWLSERVGSSGRVVATDLDTRFLEPLRSAIVHVQQHNIVNDPLPKAAFDLVHARWVLLHLREREHVLDCLVEALKPGGWLLLEEGHVYRESDEDSVLGRGRNAFRTAAEAAGASATWAQRLPEALCERRLAGVSAEADVMIYRGGSPLGEFWKLSYQQLRDRVASAGRETRALDEVIPVFDDTTIWFQGPITMAAWGQRA